MALTDGNGAVADVTSGGTTTVDGLAALEQSSRRALGLSFEDLAERAGVSVAAPRDLEVGASTSAEHRSSICAALGMVAVPLVGLVGVARVPRAIDDAHAANMEAFAQAASGRGILFLPDLTARRDAPARAAEVASVRARSVPASWFTCMRMLLVTPVSAFVGLLFSGLAMKWTGGSTSVSLCVAVVVLLVVAAVLVAGLRSDVRHEGDQALAA